MNKKSCLILVTLLLALTASSFAYYDPTTHAFVSRDPIREEGGVNLYAYCNDNPVGNYDPIGEWDVLGDYPGQFDVRRHADGSFAVRGDWIIKTGPGLLNAYNAVPNLAELAYINFEQTGNPKFLEDPAFLSAARGGALNLVILGAENPRAASDYLAGAFGGFLLPVGFGQLSAPSINLTPSTPLPRRMMGWNATADTGGLPDQLSQGVDYETQRLAALNLPKNTTVFRPSLDQVQSAAFQIIVGPPEYTPMGQLVGTIFDSTEGGLFEVKGGASLLNSSYQMRLQTYNSVLNDIPFTLETTRPLNPTLQNYFDRWGVTVRPPGTP